MSRLSVSIITPSFNQAPFIERTIRSVLDQTGDFDVEYLVIDGGSSDGTLDILRKYDGRLVWLSEPDAGQSDAVNKGLRRASGNVVGWLNSDDVLAAGALERVATAFRDNPAALWVFGRCDIIGADDRPLRRWLSAYKDWCCRHYSYAQLVTENFISQMTVFWRRALLDQIGYLDPDLHYAMDYDLWLRLARQGDPVYIPEPLACFRWYPASKSGSRFRKQFAEDYQVALRHAPERTGLHLVKRCKTARALAIYELLSWLRRIKRGAVN